MTAANVGISGAFLDLHSLQSSAILRTWRQPSTTSLIVPHCRLPTQFCSSTGSKAELIQRVIAALYPQHASAIMGDRDLNKRTFNAAAAAASFDASAEAQAAYKPSRAVQSLAAASSPTPKPDFSNTNARSSSTASNPKAKARGIADSYKNKKRRPPVSDATREKLRIAAAERSRYLTAMKAQGKMLNQAERFKLYGTTKRRALMPKMMSCINGRMVKWGGAEWKASGRRLN